MEYYIASCVFTSRFPALSRRIQDTVSRRYGPQVVRCCVGRYKLREFEARMPEGTARDSWAQLPDSGAFRPGDRVYSLCHNCNNIIEEQHPGVEVRSLWELIDEDPYFPFPDYGGEEITVQDCWIAFEKRKVQDAVRSLLRKMNFRIAELPENYEKTRFCGENLLGPCTESNRQLVHHRYVELYPEMFTPMTEEEKDAHFRAHCGKIRTRRTACYCRFCRRGIERGGKEALHMLQLLFPASEGSQV